MATGASHGNPTRTLLFRLECDRARWRLTEAVVVTELVLYEKEHCSLCDRAREVVEDVLDDLDGRVALSLRCIDIRSDAALFARYRHDVPVLASGGADWFRHRVDAAQLAARLLDGTATPLEGALRENAS
jgi:hypothetical protein